MTTRRLFLFGGLATLGLAGCTTGNQLQPQIQAFSQLGAGGRPYEVPAQYRAQIVDNPTGERPGTVVVEVDAKYLYFVMDDGRAMRYGIGVGREGTNWRGRARVGRKAEWPGWTPTANMRRRQPSLPVSMPGGPMNPLGARALYLYRNGRDTMYRIHGSNEPWSIGRNVSSGCIRLINEDVMDLYERVPVGAPVVVR